MALSQAGRSDIPWGVKRALWILGISFCGFLPALVHGGNMVAGDGQKRVPPEPSVLPQNLLGMPSFSFGRMGAATDLPGYAVGTAYHLHQFKSDFEDGGGDLRSDDFSLWTPVLPVNLGDFHLFGFASYRATWFRSSLPELLPGNDLNVFRFPVAFVHDVSERWMWGGFVMPGYGGAASSWNSEGFSLSALLGAAYAWSPRFNLGAGVLYYTGFNQSYVAPGVGFTWRPVDDWELFLIPPSAGITCSINEKTLLSAGGTYDSARWNFAADGAAPERNIHIRRVRVGLKLERQIGGPVWGYVSGGYSLFRKLEIEDRDGTLLREEDIEPAPYVQVGVNARF